MNLNISVQVMNNFQGNNESCEVGNSQGDFEGFFNGLEDKLGQDKLDINEDSGENQGLIDYSMLESILNSILKISKQDNKQDNKNMDELRKLIDGFNNQTMNIEELVKKLNTELPKETLNRVNEMFSKIYNSETGNDIINQLKEDLNTDDIKSILDKIKLQNGESNSISEEAKQKGSLDGQKNNSALNLDVNQKYQELEVSSLSNKNNISKNSDSEEFDKELSKLEDILDSGETNKFVFSNNVVATNQNGINSEPVNLEQVKEVRQEYIGDDIVKTVKYLKSNGLEEITIKISPRELGEMTIKLVKDAGDTNLEITISKDDVFDLVKKNIGDITKHLSDMNIKVKDISIDIKNNNTKIFQNNLNQEFDRKNGQNENSKKKYKHSQIEEIDDINENRFEEDNLNILI